AGVQDRVGPADRVLNLGVLAQATGAGATAARRLSAGELDQRLDARSRDAGDHGAVVRPDPGLSRDRVGDPRPALPLVVERNAGVDHRASLRQEHVGDGPVEAAGRAHAGDVPASFHDLRFRALENAPPVGKAVRAAARLIAVEDLKAAEHPRAFLTAGTERPAPGYPVAAVDGHGASAAHHRGPGDDRVGAAGVDLVDAVVRQAERDQLADAVVGHIPAGRARALGQELDDA